MARPRSPKIDSEMRECPVHGMTEYRVHKVGTRAGKQRYRRRCVKCHAERNKRNYRQHH